MNTMAEIVQEAREVGSTSGRPLYRYAEISFQVVDVIPAGAWSPRMFIHGSRAKRKAIRALPPRIGLTFDGLAMRLFSRRNARVTAAEHEALVDAASFITGIGTVRP
jgi:hypothetical protein